MVSRVVYHYSLPFTYTTYIDVYLLTKSAKSFQKIFTDFSLLADIHMRIRAIIIGTCSSKKELANRHLRKKKNINL